ncbi:FmdE family protein [Neisseria meningitidis]|uniref:FmdE family protein n=1 Tax=Neisseria meningitidis TaxID=487 RepID=UPI000FCCCBA2|nr:FmdE family protein [Neisseria meningitidis]MCL6045407.1 FmdE family protein [Neisseria meningitidis]
MTQEHFPSFFNQAPTITVRDPLAAFLGAAENGILTYRYADAVRLCGHSCPTVAGAYLMVIKGLEALYGAELPQRGDIEAFMQGGRDEGTTGVTASVVQLLTGAAPETGFGGVGPAGRFARRHLLSFGAGEINGTLALRRRDTGKTVAVSLNAALQPFAPEMRELMPKAVGGSASAEELERFGQLWQARVKAFLTESADDPQFVIVREV